jgi:molybdenum cofactor biosynthesis protein B
MAHSHHSKDARNVCFAVLTVSDTRSAQDDVGGLRIREMVEAAGHRVGEYRIVPDERAQIRWALHTTRREVEAIVLTGGTGIAPRDVTFEVVRNLLDKEISGFGELFRLLSYEQIGAAAMLSRAVAGVARGRLVFALPGSVKGVELAMERLILPQVGHMVGLVGG